MNDSKLPITLFLLFLSSTFICYTFTSTLSWERPNAQKNNWLSQASWTWTTEVRSRHKAFQHQEGQKRTLQQKCHLSQQGIRVSPRHWVQNHLSLWTYLLHLGYSSGWTVYTVQTQLSLITFKPINSSQERATGTQDSAFSVCLSDKESWGNPVMTPSDFNTHGLKQHHLPRNTSDSSPYVNYLKIPRIPDDLSFPLF